MVGWFILMLETKCRVMGKQNKPEHSPAVGMYYCISLSVLAMKKNLPSENLCQF